MKLRIMTIASVFSIAVCGHSIATAAEPHGTVVNPLRSPNRGLLFGNALNGMPAPPADVAEPHRSPPGLWRNPSFLQTPEMPPRSGAEVAPGNALPPAAASGPEASQPSRTLIQRLRERRLAQLEKQAQRLRELAQQEGTRPTDGQGNDNPNGPVNADIQIDLGGPLDESASPHANPAPLNASRSLDDTPLIGPYPDSEPPTGTAAPDLNPPADPPIDVQIELPDDPVPAQPKPPIQARLRTWWSSTTR